MLCCSSTKEIPTYILDYADLTMASSTTMETYLSLASVLLISTPGLVSVFRIWRTRAARKTQNLGSLPSQERRIWSVTWPCDANLRPFIAPNHRFCAGDVSLASLSSASHSMPDLSHTERVSGYITRQAKGGMLKLLWSTGRKAPLFHYHRVRTCHQIGEIFAW